MEKWWSILPKASQGLWAAFYWHLGQPSQRIEIRVEALLAKFRDNPFTLTLSLVWQLKAGQAQVVKQDWHSRSGCFFSFFFSISSSMSTPPKFNMEVENDGFFHKEHHLLFRWFSGLKHVKRSRGCRIFVGSRITGFLLAPGPGRLSIVQCVQSPWRWGKLVIKVPSFFSQWLVVYDMKKSPKSWHVMRYLSKG